jgi:hypothetical protein
MKMLEAWFFTVASAVPSASAIDHVAGHYE